MDGIYDMFNVKDMDGVGFIISRLLLFVSSNVTHSFNFE